MKNIIIREYLESLTESGELDYIFPILLEVMEFKIISTPKQTRGLAQYGKDIVAIGKDSDGIRKRFYFEVKGGEDRDVTTTTYTKKDGIRESLIEAKDRGYKDSSNPGFEHFPIKIVLVHNGVIKANVKETFDGFIESEFDILQHKQEKNWKDVFRKKAAATSRYQFERWDIYMLTELFTNKLFNEYLLTDEEGLTLFKKVLVLINTPRNNNEDFFRLIHFVFKKAGRKEDMGERKRLLFFETIKMICFIVYQYSRDANNLTAAKKCIPYAVLRLWSWILENNLEGDAKTKDHFEKTFAILYKLLDEYFIKTLPVARLKNGLWSSSGGRYERIGYPVRSMEYLSWFVFYLGCQTVFETNNPNLVDEQLDNLLTVLNENDGTARPWFDNHSIPITLTINYLITLGRLDDAKRYLAFVLDSIQLSYYANKRLPDGNNSMENVIRLVVKDDKSIYYEIRTSTLFAILLEYTAVLDMKDLYENFKSFLEEIKIDLGIFIPYDDETLRKNQPNNTKNHELNLFTHELSGEGYQSEVKPDAVFEDFQHKIKGKDIFSYGYRTQKAGMDHLILLAHIYFKTPFFPGFWRNLKYPTGK